MIFKENVPKLENAKSDEELVSEILSLLRSNNLPTDHPKWKTIIDAIEDEEYETNDLLKFLNEINAVAPSQGIKERFYGHSKELNETQIMAQETEIRKLIDMIKSGSMLDLGDGNSANVYLDPNHQAVCLKILKGSAIDDPKINSVKEEADFLDRAKDICINGARSPRPYCYHIDKSNGLSILAMETFEGIRLDELIRQKIAIPNDFDFEEAFSGLEQYIDVLNKEKGIRHNDLYTRNIILDLDGRCFRIIDFGKSEFKKHVPDSISNDRVNLEKIKKAIMPYFSKDKL